MNENNDPRLNVFCSFSGPDVFQSVQHANMIGEPDPYDVEEIHVEAREIFERYLNRATIPGGSTHGRVILLQGESGSGKTHLMRAFRNYVHSRGLGCFAYMQMTTSATDYGKYVLNNLISFFDKPYYPPDPTSALVRLSNSLFEHSNFTSKLEELREAEMDYDALGEKVNSLAHLILEDDRLKNIDNLDSELISALLYLQVTYPHIRHPVYKYLRCQHMTEFDGKSLKAIGTNHREEADPLQVIETIGRLIHIFQNGSLVICIDQLEDIMDTAGINDAEIKFRKAISTINQLSGRIPSSIMIISSLEDQYKTLKNSLTKSALDRLENDPAPIRLAGNRNISEINLLVAKRLKYLFETQNVEFKEEESTYPFNSGFLESMKDLRTRDILIRCKEFRDECAKAERIVPQLTPPVITLHSVEIEHKWNDFTSAFEISIPMEEAELAIILAWAVETVSMEIGASDLLKVEKTEGRLVVIKTDDETIFAGICNKNPQGGSLGKQITEIEDLAKGFTPVIVRSTDFPSNLKTQIAHQLGKLIDKGGRKTFVTDSDWRMILAIKEFLKIHENDPKIDDWMKAEKHLYCLQSLRTLLDVDNLLNERIVITEPEISVKSEDHGKEEGLKRESSITDNEQSDDIHIGRHEHLPIRIDMKNLTRHAVFLGGTGSGKTTVALNIIEQILLKGIPAVLIDRKGDLCGYAKRNLHSQPAVTANLDHRRKKFAEKIETVVFTPGDPRGRPLAISVVPDGLSNLSSIERQQVSRFTAEAIAGMMGYRTRLELNRIPILSKAIELLAEIRKDHPMVIQDIIDFVGNMDPILINAVGPFDKNLFKKLAEDMQLLKLNIEPLLAGKEKLTAETLLGHGNHAKKDKTRLTVISTKFLGDHQKIQFWVMQLLLEVSRWASKNPSETIQAVLFFDEADMYLPAIGKPATKEPMEDLLKRGRSKGIGLLLASQNPGDFDYKCRDNIQTWLVGKIQEKTSLSKMRPMFSDYSALEIESELSGQETGEFHLLSQKKVQSFKADRSLMKTDQLSESDILALAKGEEELFKKVECPKCRQKYRVPPAGHGKRLKGTCKKCGEKISVSF